MFGWLFSVCGCAEWARIMDRHESNKGSLNDDMCGSWFTGGLYVCVTYDIIIIKQTKRYTRFEWNVNMNVKPLSRQESLYTQKRRTRISSRTRHTTQKTEKKKKKRRTKNINKWVHSKLLLSFAAYGIELNWPLQNYTRAHTDGRTDTPTQYWYCCCCRVVCIL